MFLLKIKTGKRYISNPNKYLNKLAKLINLNFLSKSKKLIFLFY